MQTAYICNSGNGALNPKSSQSTEMVGRKLTRSICRVLDIFRLKVYDPITFGFIHIEMEFWVTDESSYFSHYACTMLCATYIACKSYKRKRSESSEIW